MSGDFGYGWRLGFGDAKLEVNTGTLGDAGYGGYPAFVNGTRVTMTMAGKEREGFTFTPYLQYLDSLGLISYWHPAFTPDPGVLDNVTVPDALLSQDANGNFYSINPYTGGYENYNPADPYYGGTYTSTDVSGLASTIDANSGKLLSMTARNGNSLTFASSAITSNTGRVVTITRNPAGQITAITDPRGNSVLYGYDINGNLVSVTDRAGDPATGYAYDPNHPHYLNQIQQPIAIVNSLPVYVNSLTVTYDSSTGRMTQVTDANGNALNFGYDTTNLNETITDPNLPSGARTATVSFDNRGDPLNVADPTGAQTSATFKNTGSLRDLPDSMTQLRRNSDGSTTSLTTSVGYDTNGDVTSTTDPTQATTRITYGPFGQILTASDALGDTVANSYDSNGNLLSNVRPTGVATFYGYNPLNELTSVTQGTMILSSMSSSQSGAVTKYAYDNFGN